MSYDLAKWIQNARKHAKMSQEALGHLLSMTKGNVSAMECGNVNPTYDLIVKISQICNFPMPHSNSPIESESDAVVLHQYDISGRNGNPQIGGARDLIRAIQIPKSRLMEIIGRSDTVGIEMAFLASDGMLPTIDSKTVMFIDTNIRTFAADGIYFFSMGGHSFIKRLMRLSNDKIMAISDNKAYPSFEIDLKETQDFSIWANVVAYMPLNIVQL